MKKSRLYTLTNQKIINFYKFGQQLLFEEDELLAWAEKNTRPITNNEEPQKLLIKSALKKINAKNKGAS